MPAPFQISDPARSSHHVSLWMGDKHASTAMQTKTRPIASVSELACTLTMRPGLTRALRQNVEDRLELRLLRERSEGGLDWNRPARTGSRRFCQQLSQHT